MRTTIEISDELAIRAKKAAVGRRTTLRQLVEEGLRRVLDSSSSSVEPPLERLKGLGKPIWKATHPDEYVRKLRQGWE